MVIIRLRKGIPGLELVPPAFRSWLMTVVPEEISVIFPESKDFIKPMPTKDIKRLKGAGFDISAIFLEIPYCLAFFITFDPALTSMHFIFDCDRKRYYRVFTATKHYISDAHQVNLLDSIVHEKMECKENEDNLRSGRWIRGGDILREYEVWDRVRKIVARETGKSESEIEEIRFSETLDAYTLQASVPTIGSGVYVFWLDRYVKQEANKYKREAIPMPERMQELCTKYQGDREEIKLSYLVDFGIIIP